MKKNLYIVETPFQLLCAYAHIISKKETFELFIRFSGVGKNDEQLMAAVALLRVSHKVLVIRNKNKIMDLLKITYKLIDIAITKWNVVHLANYNSGFIKAMGKILQCQSLKYLDDGVATIDLQEKIKKKLIAPVDLVTIFSLEPVKGQKIEEISFESVKNSLTTKKMNYIGLMVIGQDLVEKDLMTLDEYIDCVRWMIDGERDVHYYPHRTEEEWKLNYLNRKLNVKIIKNSLPVELYVIGSGNYYARIKSIISTALITLSKISDKSKISAHIDSNILKKTEAIKVILDYISTVKTIKMEVKNGKNY